MIPTETHGAWHVLLGNLTWAALPFVRAWRDPSLSEIIGALAYLRELCGDAKDGEEMRKQMLALLDAEATTPARKARFAGAYNRGFRGFELTYRTCTANAGTVVERYLAEGQAIAREVASRYGGG